MNYQPLSTFNYGWDILAYIDKNALAERASRAEDYCLEEQEYEYEDAA
jgi:hypothetical protein